MRVIAGRFRGHQLVSFKADHIRPTTDRVKESIFNKLQADIPGARVLDLFSGTGNLAVEAISRGAEHVTAVELSKKSLAIIRQNMTKLRIGDEIDVVPDDVLRYIRRHEGPPFDVVFADPPFTEKLADSVLTALAQRAVTDENLLASHTVIIIESSIHETVHDEYPGLERYDKRDYGDKIVSYFRRKDA
jgi:16S rRNA (guanine966-N2)-methyltransferase